jgi:hypothetical protein
MIRFKFNDESENESEIRVDRVIIEKQSSDKQSMRNICEIDRDRVLLISSFLDRSKHHLTET